MSIFNVVMLAVPVVAIVGSVIMAVKMNQKGHSRKKALLMQMASFAAVMAICLVCPIVAGAATDAETAIAVAEQASKGYKYIGAAIAVGISCIGGGIAVGQSAPAAIGATSEDPKAFGKAIIFVALGEGIALYGMLISILILFN